MRIDHTYFILVHYELDKDDEKWNYNFCIVLWFLIDSKIDIEKCSKQYFLIQQSTLKKYSLLNCLPGRI